MTAAVTGESICKQRLEGHRGHSLTGDVGGNPLGPCVVLLHGGGQTRHAWRRTTAALAAAGAWVVALDLRGHGDSDWSADGYYDLDVQVADLQAVIRQLPRAQPAVIGASAGGLIALTATGEHPGLVGALVLVDVTPQVDLAGRARILDFMRGYPDGFASLEEAADAIAAYLPQRTRPRDTSGLERNLRRQPDGRWRWHWDPRFLDTFEPNLAHAVLRYSAAARGIRVPALLVRGGRSSLVTADSVRHFQELFPDAEFADVADAEHMIAGDRNDAFNDAVLEFLGRRFLGAR